MKLILECSGILRLRSTERRDFLYQMCQTEFWRTRWFPRSGGDILHKQWTLFQTSDLPDLLPCWFSKGIQNNNHNRLQLVVRDLDHSTLKIAEISRPFFRSRYLYWNALNVSHQPEKPTGRSTLTDVRALGSNLFYVKCGKFSTQAFQALGPSIGTYCESIQYTTLGNQKIPEIKNWFTSNR